MSDVVERIDSALTVTSADNDRDDLLRDAKAEIERLRGWLEDFRDTADGEWTVFWVNWNARQALAGQSVADVTRVES